MPDQSQLPPDRRPLVFAALVAVCVVAAVGYALRALSLHSAPPPSADTPSDASVLADVASRPHLVFLHSPGGDTYRQVAIVPLDALDGKRYLTPLVCQRVHMAGGEGVCMGAGQTATIFDAHFQTGASFNQPGIPTRARVSADGNLATITWFVAGHSYADSTFSTQTLLINPHTGETVADLEQFTVYKDGAQFRAVDFNFWGVTSTRDGSHFYATLASGGKTYLVRGDVAAREAQVLRENVECPSLSPDNTHLVFKRRVDPETPQEWRLAVLDLATMQQSAIPGEDHSVDDQAEWLDDDHILYAMQDEGPPATIAQDIWVASIDGSDPPRRLLRGALSPSVVR